MDVLSMTIICLLFALIAALFLTRSVKPIHWKRRHRRPEGFVIDVGRWFDPNIGLGGRYTQDGPFSAMEFRDTVLVPALLEHDSVVVDFSGVKAMRLAWLNEVFDNTTVSLLRDSIQIYTSNPSHWGFTGYAELLMKNRVYNDKPISFEEALRHSRKQ